MQKIQFMISPTHQSKQLIDCYLDWHDGLSILCFSTLPEDGTLVLKNVGVNTYHELYFVICILLHVIECTCWYIYIYTHTRMHARTLNVIRKYMVWVTKNCLLCGASIQPLPIFWYPFTVAAAIHRCAPDQVFMTCMTVSIIIQLLISCFLKTVLSYQADIIGFIMLLFKL
jgi:hypothetical protein